MKQIVLIALALLSACTTIDRQVAAFPQDLKVTVHENAGFIATQRGCLADLPWYWYPALPIAVQCGTIDLSKHRCDIFTIRGAATKHELDHCKGGDHDGLLQDYFDRWMIEIDREIAANPALRHPLDSADVAAWRADYAKRKKL